ncbi:MAG TPA: hypothetical protein VLA14_00230 [Polyangia bacterium]|nr:hypothetical protein [Polyangia bacterium]
MMRPRRFTLLVTSLALALPVAGCGDRSATWSSAPDGSKAYGLTGAVVLADPAANRVVALALDPKTGALAETSLATGHDVVTTTVGPSGGKLYVLSGGHQASLGDAQPDEAPRLTIVDGTTNPATKRDIDLSLLSDPLDGLAIDPTEHWAVLYAMQGASAAFVTNPNALVIVDLSTGAAAKPPQEVVLHSFGGHPESLIFPPLLGLPSGPTHLLVAQSDQDFTLLSLDDPTKPEITVRLADATAVTSPHPTQVVFDDGDPTQTDDARIGVSFEGLTTVMTLQLEPATDPNGYAPTINVTDVGGVPSAIAFVRTDGGLRLATLQPARASAVLVDPVTTLTSTVTLPAAYQSLSLVTSSAGTAPAGAAAGPDVALLWNANTTLGGVAFWELGEAAGQPFRSIETVGIDAVVDGVRDVPGMNSTLKVLSTQSSEFFVLDLSNRTATPLLSSLGVTLSVSPSGARVWAYEPGGLDLAATDLATGRVHTLRVDTPLSSLFEIAGPDGAPTLVVLQGQGGVGATVFGFDKLGDPDEASRRIYGAILTEGPL